MTKTPEQMAEEYATATEQEFSLEEEAGAYKGFLAGYQAAKDTYKDAISAYEDVAKQMLEEAVRIMSPKDQLADTGKVVTADYVETASNDAKELITKFELQGDQDMLIKALVAAYCSGVDAVDGYLRNSLSAYRNSVKRLQWISVKERLPEEGLEVLIFGKILNDISKILGVRARFNGDQEWKYTWESEDIHIYTQDDVTHWMPLPTLPKEEK